MKQIAAMSANVASALSGEDIIAAVVEGHYAMNIHQIKWLFHNLASTLNIRVCADCFNDSTRSGKVDPKASSDGFNSVIDKVSSLDIGAETGSKTGTNVQRHPVGPAIDCKCGMPLCICEAPAPATTTDAPPLQMKTSSASTSQSNPKPKKNDADPRNRGSTSTQFSLAFSHGQINNGAADKPQMDYEVNGEGLREAIKNGDTAAVKKLLSEGVDANYHDKQGMSVLHLAALFNRTDIAFTLMESGASLDYKNAQDVEYGYGLSAKLDIWNCQDTNNYFRSLKFEVCFKIPARETPLDCAPATLQYKMRMKMEEHGQQVPHATI